MGPADESGTPYFTRLPATISAMSWIAGAPVSSCAASSVNMRMQNGQPVATVLAPVLLSSRQRLAVTRSRPGSSVFQNWLPPAPQQKLLLLLRSGSVSLTPEEAITCRG